MIPFWEQSSTHSEEAGVYTTCSFLAKSKFTHLTAKKSELQTSSPQWLERDAALSLHLAGVMGQRKKNTWPHMKDKSPSKHQEAENSLFFFKPKMCKWIVFE